MTDRTSLTGDTAAGNCADNVQLVHVVSQIQRLTNDQLQSIQTEVFVNASAVDRDAAVARIQTNSCNRVLTSAGTIIVFTLDSYIFSAPFS